MRNTAHALVAGGGRRLAGLGRDCLCKPPSGRTNLTGSLLLPVSPKFITTVFYRSLQRVTGTDFLSVRLGKRQLRLRRGHEQIWEVLRVVRWK